MNELRICFEVNGLAFDENGSPCPAGMELSLGQVKEMVDYTELAENINIPSLLKITSLSEMVKPEDVRIITPEEYDAKYGDEE